MRIKMNKKQSLNHYSKSYIRNIFKLIIIASFIISLAVIITGILGYNTTKNSLIDKAKSQDIVFIVKSMEAKIDGRISRAVETSNTFAKDPSNVEWVKSEERDVEYRKIVLNKMDNIARDYDYSNFFIAGVKTKQYYRANLEKNEHNRSFIVLSEDNLEDQWFWKMLKSKKATELNIGYDTGTGNTYLYVNSIMGSVDNPVGITGVGVNLNEITKEFKEFKVGKESSLWMVDGNGVIQLSDIRDKVGKKYENLVPKEVINQINNKTLALDNNVKVSEYYGENGKVVDYAYCKLASSDWILFYKIPRSESISLIDSLKITTSINVVIILIFFIILFYFISRKIANPYKQAILINMELEKEVKIRTKELKDANEKVNDSIQYAKRLQESILPSNEELRKIFKDNFVIWRPRDIVGGDFFWLREIDDVVILVVGDCTGHGVPGAFMTMTVNAILHNIVDNLNKDKIDIILRELHMQLKQALNKNSNPNSVDDGIDVAIFSIYKKSFVSYLGANIDLYIKREKQVQIIKAQSKGVGYNYIKLKDELKVETLQAKEGDVFIVTTDGFVHQNGGEKNYPFGKKRLENTIQQMYTDKLDLIKIQLENELETYMGDEEQRDDVTAFGFRLK
jgi:serine phosphatase RsbU (regulator of sigma subunit)